LWNSCVVCASFALASAAPWLACESDQYGSITEHALFTEERKWQHRVTAKRGGGITRKQKQCKQARALITSRSLEGTANRS
jgi:hypothetical protein